MISSSNIFSIFLHYPKATNLKVFFANSLNNKISDRDILNKYAIFKFN